MWIFSSESNFVILAYDGEFESFDDSRTLILVALADITWATVDSWPSLKTLVAFTGWVFIRSLSTVDVATALIGTLGLVVNASAWVAVGWIFIPSLGIGSFITAAINTLSAFW